MELAKYSILAVDDDPDQLALITHNFSEASIRVIPANSAREGCARLQSESVDLVLCDVEMPEIDGFEFCRIVRGNPNFQTLPFVFLTSKSQAEYEIRGLSVGADEYLKKPCEPSILLARVQALLKRHALYAIKFDQDPLTHLLNRRALEREIERELVRLQRHLDVASMAFIDLDNFKQINDQNGHKIGDAILVRFAEILDRNKREGDVAGRYGGEEFIVYFPGTDEKNGLKIVGRFRDLFQVPLPEVPNLRLSFSCGLVEVPRDGRDFDTLRSRSDQAMYRAKRVGKNQTVVWNPQWEKRGNRGE